MKILVNAYLDNNIGDDLMLKLLAERFSEYDFYLFTHKSIVKNTFNSYENIHFNIEGKHKYDAYLTIGGSMFANIHTFRGQISRLKHLFSLFNLKRKKIKIAMIGCNLEEKKSKIGFFLMKAELRMQNLISVRDKYSYNLLSMMKGINNYFLDDDIVYQLNPAKYKKNAEQCLGISVYRSVNAVENNLANYIALAKISDDFIQKTGKMVKLFCFDSEQENDLSAAHHIYNFAVNKDQIIIVPYLGNIDEFLMEFCSCEKVIAIRFHSAVLSDLFSIPFLPIAYSNKMTNLMHDKGVHKTVSLSELTSDNININELVDNLISGKNLYYPEEKLSRGSLLHFQKLKEFLTSIEKEKH